jgi:hypothetical protein
MNSSIRHVALDIVIVQTSLAGYHMSCRYEYELTPTFNLLLSGPSSAAPCVAFLPQVHSRLAAVAAAGEQPLPVPARRGFRLPWQQQQQEEQQLWRLLDLSEVRPLYKDAQRRGTLFKQHAKVQQRLAEQLSTAPAGGPGGSSLQDAPEQQQQQQQQQGGVGRRAVASRLDDFLVVSELLRGLGDTPKDLLEDSFALITRTERWAGWQAQQR